MKILTKEEEQAHYKYNFLQQPTNFSLLTQHKVPP